ncbi:putative ubiquitin-conjugating enzyme E2 38 [Papaver somniferum]|uniref:putative ubiquitin-conjugating enzyme E2 38 n=1 Tax=Papaver somniferum TaxID=3469 RepID=UPI000E705419|nr:putative ubiquitin-conjugating enzyme E2 38 [Papaver somniferum]
MDIFDVESIIDNIFDKKEEDQGIQNKEDEDLQKRLKRDEDEYLKHKKKFNQFAVIFNDDLVVHGDEVNANYDSRPGEEDFHTKKIMEDWKLLKEGLPGTIFVRAYKGCKDFLQAVIVGEPGTPFHDGLFSFKITFPVRYPKKPPDVTYHSHGLHLHPKLGWDGKVRLSLLKKKTWNDDFSKSNVLRVLMSI